MLFWICLAGPLLFLAVSLLLGKLAPDYTHAADEMSYLVYSPYGKWQTANFLGCGILTIGLAYLLISSSSSSAQGIYLVQVGAWALGSSLILLRVFPTQKKSHKTYISQIHKVIFVLSVLIQGILQLLFASKNPHTTIAYYLLVSGTITLIGLPAMFIWKNRRGLAQR